MKTGDLKHEELRHAIAGAFFDVYNTLGFGFLKGLYVSALERELRDRGHEVGREVHVPIMVFCANPTAHSLRNAISG